MTKGDINGITFLGRPIKPVAFGLSLSMFIIVVVNVTSTGRLHDSTVGNIVAVSAAASSVLLWGAWWGKSQRFVEYGLLFAMFTYIARGCFIAFTAWPEQSLFFSFASAIIAGGAYVLEHFDRQADQMRASNGAP